MKNSIIGLLCSPLCLGLAMPVTWPEYLGLCSAYLIGCIGAARAMSYQPSHRLVPAALPGQVSGGVTNKSDE